MKQCQSTFEGLDNFGVYNVCQFSVQWTSDAIHKIRCSFFVSKFCSFSCKKAICVLSLIEQ